MDLFNAFKVLCRIFHTMLLIKIVFCLGIFEKALAEPVQSCSNVSATESDVTQAIFTNRIHHWERPVKDPSRPITIQVRLAIQSLLDVVSFDESVY